MAQVRDTPLDADPAAADVATLGRSGHEGAPGELKKRYVALGTGLVAAAAGAAIIFGGTGPFGDNLGLTPAAPSESPNDVFDPISNDDWVEDYAQTCLFNAEEQLQEQLPASAPADLITSREEAREAGPLRVAAAHEQPGYKIAVVQNSATQSVCAGDENGTWGTNSIPTSSLDGSLTVISYVNRTDYDYSETVIVGIVADDVISVTAEPSEGRGDTAYIADGYFSVLLDSPDAVRYVITHQDGSRESVQGTDFSEQPTDTRLEFGAECSRWANDPEGYGLSEKAQAALLVSPREDSPVMIAEHDAAKYMFAVFANAEAQTVCVGDHSDHLDISQTLDAASKPEVMEQISFGQVTESGDIVEVGRVAATVSTITIETPEGNTAEAIVQDNYYSALLEKGADAAALTYEVTFEDGSAETITDP